MEEDVLPIIPGREPRITPLDVQEASYFAASVRMVSLSSRFISGGTAPPAGLIYPLITSGLFILTSIAELVLVFVLSARVQTLQPSTATGIFFAYAVLNGLNLSSIFLAYDFGSLILAFLVGAVYFGVMAVYGNVTNRDLTGWGPKLMGGLVALIVCGLVGGLFSLFGFGFGIMDLVLCAVGLLIFMGLTAYDTQMLKYYYSYFGGDAAMLHKSSIIGALNLYLDFINIFLYILRMLGRRSND